MKTLIEINDTRFIVEIDPTIPADTIRVSSIDKLMKTLAGIEPAAAAAAATNNTKRVVRGGYVRSTFAPRGVVVSALNTVGVQHLDEQERAVMTLRYGKHPRTNDQTAATMGITANRVSELTLSALGKLGIEPKRMKPSKKKGKKA